MFGFEEIKGMHGACLELRNTVQPRTKNRVKPLRKTVEFAFFFKCAHGRRGELYHPNLKA